MGLERVVRDMRTLFRINIVVIVTIVGVSFDGGKR